MSQDRDLDQAIELVKALGRMPPPEVPAGLAARIVQNVTQMPQSDPAPTILAAEPVAASRRRWLLPAAGTAIAASLVAAVLLRGPATPDHAEPNTPAVAAADTPKVLPVKILMPDLKTAEIAKSSDEAVTTPKPAKTAAPRMAAGTSNRAPPPAPAASPSPAAEPARDPAPAQVELAQREAPRPDDSGTEQALVGPPLPDGLGATLSPGVTGRGFTGGTGTPTLPPGQSGSAGGRTLGGAPRF